MIFLLLIILFLLFCLFIFVVQKVDSRIFQLENLPFSKYTLVLGAGLEKDGRPTDILSDRVKTAINLINHKKTDFLILSGSSNSQNFCEPESMRNLALSLGVDDSKLVLDNQGMTTFDSLINFLKDSGNDHLTIVTQMFHLHRALWLAESLGIKANGTPANIYEFSVLKTTFWYLREVIALPVNYFKLLLFSFNSKDKTI